MTLKVNDNYNGTLDLFLEKQFLGTVTWEIIVNQFDFLISWYTDIQWM